MPAALMASVCPSRSAHKPSRPAVSSAISASSMPAPPAPRRAPRSDPTAPRIRPARRTAPAWGAARTPLVLEHQLKPLVEEEVAALERRRRRPQRGQELGRLGGRAERDERGDPRAQQRGQLPAHARDDPQCPFRADEQRGQVVAGVVLAQTGESRDRRSRRPAPPRARPHGLEPCRGAAPGRRRHHRPPPRRPCRSRGRRSPSPRPRARPGPRPGARPASRRRRRSPVPGRCPGHRSGPTAAARPPPRRIAGRSRRPGRCSLPAARRRPMLGARCHHARHLGAVGRAHDAPRASPVAPGVVGLVGRGQVGIGKDLRLADNVAQKLLESHRGKGTLPPPEPPLPRSQPDMSHGTRRSSRSRPRP